MEKLYKHTANEIYNYYEVWLDTNKVVVHTGVIGHIGETEHIHAKSEAEKNEIYATKIAKAKNEGYTLLAPEYYQHLVIQFETEGGGWGSQIDLDKRDALEHMLNEALGWSGNGHCDGGDIGSGTINLFCLVVDAKLAVQTIVDKFTSESIVDEPYVIGLRVQDDIKVLYPADYNTEFSF
ncbi:MAG: hypothetical protein MUF19_02810 [Candidatus Pacebacteria bacterium]|jgi:hypothetical protein|nr:hypothetical protein [Candidatus Paceibacterota bacterium]